MKVAFLEHIKESLKKVKEDTSNKISALGTKTVEAIEEIEAQKADTSHKHGAGDINSGTLPVSRGGTGNTTGNAATATKLATARTIRTNLGSTNTASFDGTANITPGVDGILPVANDGTGATSASAARTALGAFSSSGGTISGNVKMNGTVAEGYNTTASGQSSHAEGYGTIASGHYSSAAGHTTTADGWYQTTVGCFSKEESDGRFIVGVGMFSSKENGFRVDTLGKTYGKGAHSNAGADYAEYFQWLDNNIKKEDRIGLFVTLDGERIRLANPDDNWHFSLKQSILH